MKIKVEKPPYLEETSAFQESYPDVILHSSINPHTNVPSKSKRLNRCYLASKNSFLKNILSSSVDEEENYIKLFTEISAENLEILYEFLVYGTIDFDPKFCEDSSEIFSDFESFGFKLKELNFSPAAKPTVPKKFFFYKRKIKLEELEDSVLDIKPEVEIDEKPALDISADPPWEPENCDTNIDDSWEPPGKNRKRKKPKKNPSAVCVKIKKPSVVERKLEDSLPEYLVEEEEESFPEELENNLLDIDPDDIAKAQSSVFDDVKQEKPWSSGISTYKPEFDKLRLGNNGKEVNWENFEVEDGRRDKNFSFQCEICLFGCNSMFNMVQHNLRHEYKQKMKETGFNYFCVNCKEGFENEGKMRLHVTKMHKKREKTVCEYCKKEVSTAYMGIHIATYHDLNKRCPVCGYDKSGKRTYKEVLAHMEKAGPFHLRKCEQCEQSLNSWAEKEKHMREVHNDKWMSRCDECGDVFDNKVLLRKHMGKFHPKDLVGSHCDICGKVFAHRTAVYAHRKRHHPVNEDPVKCEVCGKVCVGSVQYKSHMEVNHGTEEKPMEVCSICGKNVTQKRMKRHMRTAHMPKDQRPYPCQICPKRFLTEQQLEEHINVHTGEKPFKCDYCASCFANRSNKRIHERTVHMKLSREINKGSRAGHDVNDEKQ